MTADSGQLLKSGYGQLARQDHAAAEAISDRLLRDFEPTPEILLFAGEVRFRRGKYPDAESIAARCMSLFPAHAAGALLRCRTLLALGKMGEARDLAVELSQRDIVDEQQVDVLVTILSGCLVPEAAYPIARASAGRHPASAAAQRRLAVNCQALGRIDEALVAAEAAIRIDGHDYDMIGLRSALETATEDDNHIAELEALLTAGCRTQIGAARAAYALAKELEDVGRFERSFAVLQAAATFKRQTLAHSLRSDDLEMLRLMSEHYTADRIDGGSGGHDSRAPVFVVGLPRTGSTLLERMLSGHSSVEAAGELLHFEAATMIGLHRLGTTGAPRDIVSKSTRLDPTATGRDYLERTRFHTGSSPHFIDKRPLNYVWLGAIRRALPNATVIHVRRTPMDACYAIYKFLFEDAYPWSYDLEEIARYYVAYRKLMDHWRSVMPDFVVEVGYEELVADAERVLRRVLDRMGLDWEPAVLDFHASNAPALTGSAVQVRREIYSTSVGRWRNYEKQLQPLARSLESAGIDPFSP